MPNPDPAAFPLQTFSNNSLTTYWKCPYKWKLKNIDGKRERSGGPLIAGAAAGSAENKHFWSVFEDKAPLSVDDVADAFNDGWDAKVEEETDKAGIDWGGDKPEDIRSTSQGALALYHEQHALKEPKPIAIEREAKLRITGMPWVFKGYLDREIEDPLSGQIVKDMKMSGKKADAKVPGTDTQVDSYLLLRRAEGNPAARFDFDRMVRTQTPSVQIQPAVRSDTQLDAFLRRLLSTAGDIAMRVEYDKWEGAVPGSWYCSERWCGFWSECPFGGLAATRAAQATRAAGKPEPVAA